MEKLEEAHAKLHVATTLINQAINAIEQECDYVEVCNLVDEIIIETGINECRCDEAFTSRGRHESNTNCHLIGHYEKRLQEILDQ